MLKPLITTIIVATGLSLSAISNSHFLGSGSYGAEVYETIDVMTNQGLNINYYPKTLHVCQGDTLHLTVRNDRTHHTRFFMPSFNIDQDIPKGGVATFDLCVANPSAKNLWYSISTVSAKNIPGLMVVSNFQTPVVMTPSRNIDTSVLSSIINYSKDYCYSEKQPPVYKAPSAGVRGYW